MKRWIKWTAAAPCCWCVIVDRAQQPAAMLPGEQSATAPSTSSPAPWPTLTDAQTIERGRYLYASRGCTYCHGAQGTGREFVNDGKGTRIVGPNITPAGVVARYQPEDWNSVIRHGVKPNGRPVLVMPSEDYNRFTNEDLNALVPYVRQFPPKEGAQAVIDLPHPPCRCSCGLWGRQIVDRLRLDYFQAGRASSDGKSLSITNGSSRWREHGRSLFLGDGNATTPLVAIYTMPCAPYL